MDKRQLSDDAHASLQKEIKLIRSRVANLRDRIATSIGDDSKPYARAKTVNNKLDVLSRTLDAYWLEDEDGS
jgi:hypothetical protein